MDCPRSWLVLPIVKFLQRKALNHHYIAMQEQQKIVEQQQIFTLKEDRGT
jgi:hypothetical protein